MQFFCDNPKCFLHVPIPGTTGDLPFPFLKDLGIATIEKYPHGAPHLMFDIDPNCQHPTIGEVRMTLKYGNTGYEIKKPFDSSVMNVVVDGVDIQGRFCGACLEMYTMGQDVKTPSEPDPEFDLSPNPFADMVNVDSGAKMESISIGTKPLSDALWSMEEKKKDKGELYTSNLEKLKKLAQQQLSGQVNAPTQFVGVDFAGPNPFQTIPKEKDKSLYDLVKEAQLKQAYEGFHQSKSILLDLDSLELLTAKLETPKEDQHGYYFKVDSLGNLEDTPSKLFVSGPGPKAPKFNPDVLPGKKSSKGKGSMLTKFKFDKKK